MGVDALKLRLIPSSFRRRVILRALVIVCAFSVVSVIRNLGGAYDGEEDDHHHPHKVDECAVNFAFLGPFLFSGNGLFSNRFLKPILNHLESEKCKENIDLTARVIRELTDMNLLSQNAKALCIGRRSVSAVLALNSQGISDATVAAYSPPTVFAFKHRKFTSELQYKDASFGFVFSTDLETVSVPASLVYEIERILIPGGTGAMLIRSDSTGLVRSVSPVSSLLKNSSVVHVASFGEEQVLVVFRRNGEEEDSFQLDLPGDCSSVVNNRPYIGLLEPILEEKRSDFERRIHYLPEFVDLSSRKRLVYIDIGAADHVKARSDWFFPSYPIERKAFNSYFVHHNTSILTSYVKSPGVTFIYHPGLAASKGVMMGGDEDQEESFVEDDSFDFLEWFKETASFADFVVLKMNTSESEMRFLSELMKTGAICSVDELFLHCTGYRDCDGTFKSLRESGVFVHQWWED
ncbi:unnamed protein product [Microthlaspi erraticum]|uniref:DUF7870 domain-containing protein n=1 Tax=Microthlaspi erraticum TaxID=1685480 RepID=A0A6D2K2M9_9BRAS|nr:unnamed protein product [Microthlaspi erraticum]CAA7057022.1 unnamed protein product [Microthlaspi erraticum]